MNIRNFSIIAHIDHGKSTLADRFLEITQTVEKRKMRAQVLDAMELERERGITIKMTPVTMDYQLGAKNYQLNLIDTPGHIDFSYEVSRALRAVEGAILLVDASQGVQAQTLSVLELAREAGLVIVPAINKIDLAVARVAEVKKEISELLGCEPEAIRSVSAKTGEGVEELLEEVIKKIPPPTPPKETGLRALVFDFEHSTHQGVIVYTRVSSGSLRRGDAVRFAMTGDEFRVTAVGKFRPERQITDKLSAGEIGFVVTGIKTLGKTKVGDTLTSSAAPLSPFTGYRDPEPVVWASVYPESQDDLPALKRALLTLKLSDSALSFEEESSLSLGRGFRCGFLGMLHLEIAAERLHREFGLSLLLASPTIGYEVEARGGERQFISSPHLFPENLNDKKVWEPWVRLWIILPPEHLGALIKLLNEHEGEAVNTANFGSGRSRVEVLMPLRELMRNFFSNLKSVTSGLASLSYEPVGLREADVVRMDILVGGEEVTAFSRVVGKKRVEKEAETVVERLISLIPRQLIEVRVQARVAGRIIASRRLSPLKKDVTGYLYGGDVTRKRKLWEKQKRGKKRMQSTGRVSIPASVFIKMLGGSKTS